MTTPDPAPPERLDEETLRAFTDAAPALLGRVLDELRDQSERLQAAGIDAVGPADVAGFFDLSHIDPRLPGAFGSLDPSGPPPLGPLGAGPTSAGLPPAGPSPWPPTAGPTPAESTARTASAVAPGPASAEPEPAPKTLDELLAELDGLVGLTSVKREIHRQSAILSLQAKRAAAGLKDPTITRHLVFVGNPGTGKTTVARLVGGIYRALGLLSKGQLIEVDRSELVAGYLGQTAIKTAEVAQTALGGVLFIDEAYALAGDQYGEEAINTLVKEMEDNRADLVVIVAGYTAPMARFIAENPGLASRFRTTIDFADYTDDELVGILESMAAQADYDVTPDAVAAFRDLLADQVRDDTFGNGRFVRNTFEAAIGHQAWRLRDVAAPSLAQLRQLVAEDFTLDADATVVDWPAGAGVTAGGVAESSEEAEPSGVAEPNGLAAPSEVAESSGVTEPSEVDAPRDGPSTPPPGTGPAAPEEA